MADLYANYAALAAAEVEGVAYTRTAITPKGAWWACIAIHGGLIEAGTGPLAKQVADLRGTAFYEFKGIRAGSQPDLHITSSNFDEPNAVALVAKAGRVLSMHGFTGTTGVAETLIGGLDVELRDKVKAALQAAGFTVTVAASELTGTDPTNICNDGLTRAGVQLELSRAQRQAFFPGGDLTLPSIDGADRTATFYAYANAVASAMVPNLTYDPQLSRVRLTGTAPGLLDTFTGRTVTDDWGNAESGQTWLLSGVATAFQVAGGVGKHIHTAAAVSRWSLAAVNQADWDLVGSVSTDVLAAGGGQFHSLVGRSTDDGATCYLARVEFSATQQVILTLRKRVAATETLLVQFTSSLTHAVNTKVRWRFQGVGSTLLAKVWLASGTPPAAWQLTTTDTSVTGTGRIGVRSILSTTYTGTLPVTSSWEDISTVGAAVVERSPDGVRWTAVRGATGLDGTAGASVARDDYEFAADVANQYRVRVYEPGSGKTLFVAQDSIVPALGRVWLKSVARPFLNRQVTVLDYSDVSRPARAGVFDVVGRSYPVSVSDVRGSKQWTLEVLTQTLDEAEDLALVLAGGETMLVHVPVDSGVPGGYVTIGDVGERRTSRKSVRRVFELPCVEVAAPGPDVVGATVTCQTVLSTYPTVQAMLDAQPTIAGLLELVGAPTDVVVP